MKKIEIVVSQTMLSKLLKIFAQHSIMGYTTIDIALGRSAKHGLSEDFGIVPASKHIYIFFLCQDEEFIVMKEKFIPQIKTMSSLLMVSEITKI